MIGDLTRSRSSINQIVDVRKSLMRSLLLATLLMMGAGLLLCVYFSASPEILLLALPVLALGSYLVVRFPEWFLVAALFAPQWKTFWLLRSLGNAVDLTVIMLLCLAAGLTWRVLMPAGEMNSWNFRTIFLGQLSPLTAFLVFSTLVTLSYTYTTAPDYGASKLFRFLLIGTLLLISPLFLILTEDNFRRFARIFVGCSVATAVQLIFTLEFQKHDDTIDVTRIGAGWLIGMSILLVLFYPLLRGKRANYYLYLLVLPICIAGLVASVARGPMVALSIAVLFGLASWLRQGRLRGSTALALLFVFVVGFGGAFFALRQADLGKYTAKAGEFKTLLTEGGSSGSAGKRLNFYRATLPALADHPILGGGVGSWSVFYYGNDSRNYPHNLLLEIAFEEGMAGLGVFLAFLFLVGVSTVWMLRMTRSHFLALGLLVLYCVIVSLFSGDLDDNRVLWIWVGMTLAICRNVRIQIMAGQFAQRIPNPFSTGRGAARNAPEFSTRSNISRRSFPKRSRAWHEKFVY
jgi:O-antigen ligase